MSHTDHPGFPDAIHRVSIVIPVYKGESTLGGLLAEIDPLTARAVSPGGAEWTVAEVILVFDHGPDDSARVIRSLERTYDYVRPVWLSRNFGQHSATLAGMASSGSEWIVTLDEDGQHDPSAIGTLLDAAIAESTPLVYAKPTNPPPHGAFRNAASRLAKSTVSQLAGDVATRDYQSFRLISGEIGRSVAAYSGTGVYLDVALGWVAPRATSAGVELRGAGGRSSGYSLRTLASHFWRLILSSGTKGLRLVSLTGAVFALAGLVLAVVFIVQRLTDGDLPTGWTSLITVMLFSSGAVLFSLGVIAEYLGVVVSTVMGKPPYLIVSDPEQGPLGSSRTRPWPTSPG
ncbi:glycosyltransferase [Planctomonas psychrotolerans]|uniref:glycosyltransferase n=1 Tax=Planctomonas psychrotolerans TaxID=2528712 RepID=UPI00123BE276|nr:glycosyltransferase [Planctomonas psychrotolerans]